MHVTKNIMLTQMFTIAAWDKVTVHTQLLHDLEDPHKTGDVLLECKESS